MNEPDKPPVHGAPQAMVKILQYRAAVLEKAGQYRPVIVPPVAFKIL